MEDKNITGLENSLNVLGPVDSNLSLSWLFSLDNDALELSKFLETSSKTKYPVPIVNDPSWHPLVFQTGASYITINGNEELCGSSFSDLDTSYMVGIDMGCGLGGAWDGGAEEARGWTEVPVDGKWVVNGLTGGGCDGDVLAMFVGGEVGHARLE